MELQVRDRFIEFAGRRTAVRSRYGSAESTAPQQPTEQLLIVPLWSRLPSDFEENARLLTHQIDHLSSMHALFLKPKFCSNDGEDELRISVDKQTIKIQTTLKTLGHAMIASTRLKDSYSEEEVRIVRSIQTQLTARLKELELRFKCAQELFAAQLRQREHKSSKYMRIGSDTAYETVQQEERAAQFLEMGFAEQDIQPLLVEEMRRDQASKEIGDIVDSIQEIRGMFEDLHTMVVDQGAMLDRIDYNVDKALVSASKAQIELEKARANQSNCVLM
ncbi:hypothetical protein JKF63_02147 [Porcisia hertigi]|uniref:t-SNARE coiled-coil homology domain-containing protein n=1 Tax=Porcisia hertigi TaxID=2761500 RepID=A0A836L1T0_9TRYP|nr:hypothetical protein JKF63_02147 [Porcisia hertigi]